MARRKLALKKNLVGMGCAGVLACALLGAVFLHGGELAPSEAEDPASIRDANWTYAQPAEEESAEGRAAAARAADSKAQPETVLGKDGERYGSGKVLISCDGALAEDDVRKLLEKSGVKATNINLVSKLLENNGVLLEVYYEGGQDPAELSAMLQSEDFVMSAEPDYVQTLCGSSIEEAAEQVSAKAQPLKESLKKDLGRASLAATVNDTYVADQWALSAVCADEAWDYSRANGEVTVAVIDSGVDYDHPDLKDNLILGAYAKNTYTGVVGSFAVYDIIGHGTHVAGIISACSNNGKGVSGVSYNARVLPIKVTYGLDGSMFTSDVIEAIDYVVSLRAEGSIQALKNIRVINLSLGGYVYSSTYEAAVKRAYDAGILVVAAAGNDASEEEYYPAAYDGAFSIAALKQADASPYMEVDSSYSNRGLHVDMAAPGTGIYSTVPYDGYGRMTGTSMAAAMVSGIAALGFAGLEGDVPDYMDTPAWMQSLLKIGATDLLDAGWDAETGHGAVCALMTAYMSTWRPISSASVEAIPDQDYTGQPITPKPVVVYAGRQLVEGTDYQLEYSNNTEPGSATLLIRGMGAFFDEVAVHYNIVDFESMDDVAIADIPSQEYTGSPIEPAVSASFAGVKLTEGKDFQVAYSNNTNPGQATVVVTGLGRFTGQKTLAFQIDPKVVNAPKANEGLVYNGEEQQGVSSGQGYTLSGTVSAVRAGSYVVTAALDKGCVWSDGSTNDHVIEWSLAPKKISVPEAKPEVLYTGEEQQGVPSGQGYTLSGTASAVEVGEYTAVAVLDAPNYIWEDGSSADVEIPWSIKPERYVEKPQAVEGLVYNGELQSGVDIEGSYDGKAYALSGVSRAVDAGQYEAKARLNPGYHWADGGDDAVVVSWSIARCPIDVPEGSSFPYADGGHAVFEGLANGSGSLYVWGDNGSGQLGDGTTVNKSKPVEVLDGVAFTSLGRYHSAAVIQDGSLYTWGWNSSGQLGDTTTTNKTKPVKVLDGVVSVSLGGFHSAAITENGSLYMWGDNEYGQLGNGSHANSSKPVRVLKGVVAVSLGYSHSAAVTQDGSLYTWGANGYGQLGDGSMAGKNRPVKVLDGVSAVSLGYFHSAAVMQDGSLYTWGSNGYGQLGNGTYEDSSKPAKVFSDVVSVSFGRYHSAAVTQDGSLYTWGASGSGRLGDGTVSYRCKPVKILDGVSAVSLGSDHSSCLVASKWQNGLYVVSGDVRKTQAGEYTALVEPGFNYVWPDGSTEAQEVKWSIEPKAVDLDSVVGKGLVYNGLRQIGVHSGDGYSLTGSLTAVDAGQYSAKATLWDSNYVWADGSTEPKEITWSIDPAVLTATYAGEQVSWGGQPQLKVDVTGFVEGQDASNAAGYSAPYVEAPDDMQVGEAYELTPQGGQADNYVFEYVPGTLLVGGLPFASAEASLSFEETVYNGKVQKPTVSVTYDGVQLTEGVDFQVSYDAGCKRSGTYAVTVSGMGICEGQQTLAFKIKDATLTASQVTLSAASFAYNGSVRKPTATVKVNGVSQYTSEYTVTYWNKGKSAQKSPTNVGTYYAKVVARADANTAGTVWKKFVINPKATANLTLTARDNGFKATWAKRTVQVTGYQIGYKLTTADSWNTKNVTSYSTNTKSITGLKDKKSYNVRVRTYKTVDGVKYYSAWTAVKTIKTR